MRVSPNNSSKSANLFFCVFLSQQLFWYQHKLLTLVYHFSHQFFNTIVILDDKQISTYIALL